MGTNPSYHSSRAWILAIETLASFNQVDTSLLVDLVKMAPKEILGNAGENAREMASFRILENLSSQNKRVTNGVSPNQDSSDGFDPSGRCENVLREVLHKSSTSIDKSSESEMLKCDVEPFIQHKRSCLPKCTLKQLKAAILRDNPLIPKSLKERSGLLITNTCDGNTGRPEGSDGDTQENPPTTTSVLSAKRVRNDLVTDNAMAPSTCNQVTVDNDDDDPHSNAAKKLKEDGFCTQQPMEGQNLASFLESRLVEDVSERIVRHTGRDESDLSKEPRMGVLEESIFPENVNDEYVLSKRLKMSPDIDDANLLHNKQQAPCNDEKLSQATSREEQGQAMSIDEAKEDSGGCTELKTLSNAPQDVNQQTNSINEAKEKLPLATPAEGQDQNNEKLPQDASVVEKGQTLLVDEDKEDDESCAELRTLSNAPQAVTQQTNAVNEAKGKLPQAASGEGQDQDNEKLSQDISVLEEGHTMCVDEDKEDGESCAELRTSSLQAVRQQINSVNEAKEKCEHPNGVCPGEAEDAMEHSREPETTGDDEYHDDITVKKYTFLSSQCTYSQDSLVTAGRTEQKLCMKCKKGGRLLDCSSNACPRVVHESCLGVAPTFDASGCFYCPFCAYSRAISEYMDSKRKTALAKKDLAAFIGGGEYRPRNSSTRLHVGDQNQFREDKELDEHIELNSTENLLNGVNKGQSRGNAKDLQQAGPAMSCNSPNGGTGRDVTNGGNFAPMEDNRMAQKAGSSVSRQSLREQEKQQIALQATVQDCEIQNSSCRDKSIVHGSAQQAGIQREKGVLQLSSAVLPPECVKPSSTEVEKSPGEEIDKFIASDHSLRVREREVQYTYPAIPLLRRKKVPWTSAEEEVLKEGIRRFTSDHDRTIPWKTILEFGGKVFEKGRTAVDLKDKWRNICKGSPKQ